MTGRGNAAGRGSLAYTTLLPIVAMVAVTLLAVLFVLVAAARTSDTDALARQRQLVASATDRAIDEVSWQQESVTVWDSTLEALARSDLDWLDGNAGVWMFDYFGIDRIYVVDAAGRPVYAMEDGARVDPHAFARYAQVLGPSAARARTRAAAGIEADRSEIVRVGGRPAIVGASLVRSDTGRIVVPAGAGYVHLAVRFLDGGLLAILRERTLVEDPVFVADVASVTAVHPIRDRNGTVLGGIAWTPQSPGAGLLRAMLPALGGAAVLLVGLVGWLGRRLYRTYAALEESEAEARHIAFHDQLTGLPNRLALSRILADCIAGLQPGRRCALVTIDLDRFGAVNDTFGHPVGDRFILAVCDRLTSTLRDSDTVARLGSDEFAVILSDTAGADDVRTVCDRILAAVGRPFEVAGQPIHVTASLGAALAPDHGEAADLLRKADMALHEAKSSGAGRFSLFEERLDAAGRRRTMMEHELRRALERGGELSVAFQPIVGPDRESPVGMEALARWNHPDDGARSPADFVPVAEDTGLIVPLGDLVLRQALRTAAQIEGLSLAVNISPVQIDRAEFPDRLAALIAESGFDPARLELEITETALMGGRDRAVEALARFRALGVKIVLDDFGTGYSSFGYLRSFPVDRIKIDQSFVRNAATDPSSREIVRAIITLGRGLGMSITAEGIETEAQFRAMAEAGCDRFQGFLFSPPVPAAVMIGFAAGEPLPVGRRRVRIASGAA